jgi:hypothetical protein
MTVYQPGMGLKTEKGSEGALGCIARTAGGPLGAGVAVLLGCAHMLFGNASEGTGIAVRQEGASSTCSKMPVIARTSFNWITGFRPVRINVPGEANPVRDGAETDCAIGRLAPGVQFDNRILGMNVVIAGTPQGTDPGVQKPPPFGTAPQPEHLLRFYSPVDKQVHWGTIVTRSPAFNATYVSGGSGAVSPLVWPELNSSYLDDLADARPNINQYMVLPRPAPGETYESLARQGRQLQFGQGGDSGSVVINHEDKVVGMLIRAGAKPPATTTAVEWTTASGVGWVTPIAKVLAQMQITIQAADSGTIPASGPIAVTRPTADSPTVHAGMDRFRAEARQSRYGRILLGMMARHAKEVGQIVNGCRPAIVAWHRNQGPAVIAHLLRALHDPAHEIPVVINGVPRQRLLDAMAEQFVRFGGPRLCRDIHRYRDLVLASPITTETRVDRLPAALAALPRPMTVSAR